MNKDTTIQIDKEESELNHPPEKIKDTEYLAKIISIPEKNII